FLSVVTAGVLVLRKFSYGPVRNINSITAQEIIVAIGLSQFGKLAPVVLMVWSAAPDIRLAVTSFNISACLVVIKLTSGTRGIKALYVIVAAVICRMLV